MVSVTVVPCTSLRHLPGIISRARSLAALLVLLCCCGLAHAQFDNGSITGTLRDATGAVVPGATVTIRNVATGVSTVLTTNADGTYQALALIPGTYSVEASAKGFGTSRNPSVEVHVKTRAQVDFEMRAGSTETMAVTKSGA